MAAPPAAAARLALLLVGTLALALLGLPDGAASVPVEELDAAPSPPSAPAATASPPTPPPPPTSASTSSPPRPPPCSPRPTPPSSPSAWPSPPRPTSPHSGPTPSPAASPPPTSAAPPLVRRRRRGGPDPPPLAHSDAIAVDGVELAALGVFYGRDVAVHGLRGALSIQSQFGAMDGGAPHPVLRRIPSSIFFRVPEVASPASHVNDRSSQRRSANLTDSSPPESRDRYSPSPEFPPYAAPEIQPLSAPLPASAEISSVALLGEDGDEGDRRGRYGLPGDPAPMMMPPLDGGGEREGSLEISEPFDEETMPIEEVFDDDDDEFWDDDTLLA
ncbi:hypothetical protein NL676_039459 [Syzygium grande]|nr:hypothetical protein NL676_039459 [Syzygium grande]